MRRPVLWAAGGIVAVAAGLGVAWAWQVQSSATAGRTAATAALQALQNGDAASARTQFTQAQQEFQRSRALLGPSWLQAIPLAGRQMQAIDQLAQVGAEGSSAGAQISTLIAQASDSSSGHKLNDVIKISKPYLLSATTSMGVIASVEPQLSPDGLLPPLADAVRTTQQLLAPAKPLLSRSDSVNTLVNYLFAADHRFLLVSQNNAELRPTGGFTGSFGLLKIGPSGLSLEKYADIYTLPSTNTLRIKTPPGAQMSGKKLRFRDANWWLDYPTSADTMLRLYAHLSPSQPQVDGLIAIDVITMQTLLREFGPIKVPEYGKPISADNMLPVLITLTDQEGLGNPLHRKDILKSLSVELLNRMLNITPAQVLPTSEMMVQLAHQKRIQFYVPDAHTEQAIKDLGMSGTMESPAGTTDLLGISNALAWPSKLNLGTHKTVKYQVQLTAAGTAETNLTLYYYKDKTRLVQWQRRWVGDYLRVYRPAGTTLTGSTSKRSMKPPSTIPPAAETPPAIVPAELNTTTITNGFTVLSGEKRTQTYATTVPGAMVIDQAGATAHYRLLLVKQADLEEIPTTVVVKAPDGWTISTAGASDRSGTSTVDVSTTGGQATLDTPLTTDLVLDITLTKA